MHQQVARVLWRLGRRVSGCGDGYLGGRNVSGIIGVLYTSVAFGTLIGPRAAGFAFYRPIAAEMSFERRH